MADELEKLLESGCLVVVGRPGGARDRLAKRLVAEALKKGLGALVLDSSGAFEDLPLQPLSPTLPYRAVAAYLPLALSLIPGPRPRGAEAALVDAVTSSRTLRDCLTKLASRADAGAASAHRKLSALAEYLSEDDPGAGRLKDSRVGVVAAPAQLRAPLTLLWLAYLAELDKPPVELVVFEGARVAHALLWPLLEDLPLRGAKVVVLDRELRRQHLKHTVAIADIAPEAYYWAARYRLSLPERVGSGEAIVLSNLSVYTLKV